ncbi:hypothetical protein MBRU_01740 [Mycolicibacterium brumae DSM 44177]|nr:hypothetical protein MBRU_01740 [Mycolicibacterium brumae DSM 44177]
MILSAATVVAAFGLSGCHSSTPPAAEPTTTVSVAADPRAPLPAPEVLTAVLLRLSDPAVPGNQKLSLIDGSTAGDAAALEGLTKAMADNHVLPLTVEASDLAWVDGQDKTVTATVTITPSGDKYDKPFSYPMEFVDSGYGWRLSRKTADLLLTSAGDAAATGPEPTTGEPVGATPAPTSTPGR